VRAFVCACVFVRARACLRFCVRGMCAYVCMCACMRACVRVCVCARVCRSRPPASPWATRDRRGARYCRAVIFYIYIYNSCLYIYHVHTICTSYCVEVVDSRFVPPQYPIAVPPRILRCNILRCDMLRCNIQSQCPMHIATSN
jgi:hypothetical protein